MLFRNVWLLLTEPQDAWSTIRESEWAVVELYIRVIAPLALISPVAGYIGTTQFGWQIGAGQPVKLSATSALPISIVYFGAILVSVFVIGLLIHWMSETYGGRKPLVRCIALAAY